MVRQPLLSAATLGANSVIFEEAEASSVEPSWQGLSTEEWLLPVGFCTGSKPEVEAVEGNLTHVLQIVVHQMTTPHWICTHLIPTWNFCMAHCSFMWYAFLDSLYLCLKLYPIGSKKWRNNRNILRLACSTAPLSSLHVYDTWLSLWLCWWKFLPSKDCIFGF